VKCGCFWGTIDEFEEKVNSTHGTNQYAKQYFAEIEKVRELFKESD